MEEGTVKGFATSMMPKLSPRTPNPQKEEVSIFDQFLSFASMPTWFTTAKSSF
jgi:hypothetical protein